jgi:hypothetical protein
VQKRGGARRALAIGAVLGLVSLLAFGALGKVGKRTPPEPVAAASASALPEAALANGEAQSANVPLFGATPMTTVESVPPPPPPAMAAGPEPTPETGDVAGGSSDDDDEELKKEWGERSVKNGNKLKLKLDGEADGFRASQGEQGFTLVVPGRKFVGSASELARKDKRLSMLNVVNKPDATEITVEFKGDAPEYAVKAKGETIEISLAGGDKKVASKTPAKKKDGKKKAAKAPAKSAAKAPAKAGKKTAR